jgi:ribosome maturation protein Sdo1
MCNIKKEEWTQNFLLLEVEIPAAMEVELIEKLGKLCSGDFEVKSLK